MTIPDLIDIGANLTHESFGTDRDAVLARARAAGVRRMVVTGADLEGSRQAAELCAAHPAVLWSTAGVHPHHAAGYGASQRNAFLDLLGHPSTVAVGECGLDYFRNFSPQEAQRAAFVDQLGLAIATRKPVFLHQRDAHEEFRAIVAEHRADLKDAVAHCFTGGRRELEDYVGLDLYIGVTGWVCDERRGQALREAVPHIPVDRLMLETDAPYLLPRELLKQVKGRRNEPALLPHVLKAVARLREVSVEELAAQTTRNAERFFALAP